MTREELVKKCENQLIRLVDNAKKQLNQLSIQQNLPLYNRLNNLLPEYKMALQRIKDGPFGLCEYTGDLIESKRLIAVPWTRVSMKALRHEL